MSARQCVRSVMCAAVLCGAYALTWAVSAKQSPVRDIAVLRAFPMTTLVIRTSHGWERFRVLVANTGARKERGLMFVRVMPSWAGMLFPVRRPQEAVFWMKNTRISLDILFVAPDKRIEKIVHDAKPLSGALIYSGGPITAVIEILGGTARLRGIHVGAKVRWVPWEKNVQMTVRTKGRDGAGEDH